MKLWFNVRSCWERVRRVIALVARLIQRRLAVLYLFYATVIGLILVLLIPPFEHPDEQTHFWRAYQISTLHLLGEHRPPHWAGGELPASLVRAQQLFPTEKRISPYPFERYGEAARVALNPDRRMFVHFPNTVVYVPVFYAPQALGIAVSRAFGGGPLAMFYTARVSGLLASIALMAFALSIAPAGWRVGLATVGVLPGSLAIFGSCAGDGLQIATGVFAAAWILARLVRGGQPGVPASATIALAGVCAKLVYWAWAWPAVAAYFADRERRWQRTALILAPALGFILVWLLLNQDLTGYLTPGKDVSAARQVLVVVRDPIGFAEMVWNAYFGVDFLAKRREFIGVLGWLSAHPPEWAVMTGYLLLLLGIASINRTALTVPVRISAALAVLGVMIGIALLQYLSWTEVGSYRIDGVQGRYLLPLWPSLLLTLGGLVASPMKWRRLTVIVWVPMTLGLGIGTLQTIWARYYLI